ncbi:Molybdenum transport protein, putative [Acidisarcina polymorpha]|uniref:Molybdenum transport protein, putative n=1 Tax=Acidisarcina polymorpha TaxID=2211140 RepID=A0A2Z5FWV0_9BACT|nr:cytochrome c [Acidisarcina polymorpha]AXC10994.1 Molybdenum transport protein, putative [Acidisarcina polymorpha]
MAASTLAIFVFVSGCRQDMHNQPKFVPQRGTSFFADGRSARPQVDHTVARNEVDVDDYFHTGLLNGKEQDAMPFPVSAQVLARGQERYNIYCTPCHSRVGNGAGMIVQRGYKPAGNFHDAKRLAEPLSHYFYVMTNGYGAMPDYSAQMAPEDRWAVAAYIRALQLSQSASQRDVPSGTQVENLADIAERAGYPASFAGPWELPTVTNVRAISPGEAPAAGAPAQPTNPAIQTRPAIKAPSGDASKLPAPSGN